MNKNIGSKDIITEEDFTMEMRSASSNPENDSPGDSESDAGAEFLLGVSHNSVSGEDEDDDLLDEGEEEEEEVDDELPARFSVSPELAQSIPEGAKVLSSGQPSPWMDRDQSADTN